jgi:hypothetical protein
LRDLRFILLLHGLHERTDDGSHKIIIIARQYHWLGNIAELPWNKRYTTKSGIDATTGHATDQYVYQHRSPRYLGMSSFASELINITE